MSDFQLWDWECTVCGHRIKTSYPAIPDFCLACDPYLLATPTMREVLAPYRIVIVLWQPS